METINVAEAKKHFSDILGRVFYGKEEIVIVRRNKAMVKLVPIDQETNSHLAEAKGWLDNDDEFFSVIDETMKERQRHIPRSQGELDVSFRH